MKTDHYYRELDQQWERDQERKELARARLQELVRECSCGHTRIDHEHAHTQRKYCEHCECDAFKQEAQLTAAGE
jgi:hypothetical protein